MASGPRQFRAHQVIGLAMALLLAAALARPAAAQARPSGGADPAVDMWQALRTNFENYARNMRPLPQHRMSDVMEIRPEGKYLVLRTPLNDIPAEQQMRATIDGMHGIGIVTVKRDDQATGFAEPTGFSLAFMDFPAPRETTNISVTLNPLPRQLSISKTTQTTNGPTYQVIFTQQKAPSTGGSGFVQLIVIETRAQGAAPDQINLEGSDFFSFIREHPAETEQHLRPLFREFGQEAVFAPDATAAWQVFSDLWRPDPAVIRQVDALLPALNAEDYHTRNAAQTRLEQLGRDGAAVLIHIDRSRLTPEQNARIDRALVPYAQLAPKEAARLRSDPGFLLDCLYSDSASLRAAAVNRLRQAIRPDLQFDVNASAESRAAAVQALRAQLVPSRTAAIP